MSESRVYVEPSTYAGTDGQDYVFNMDAGGKLVVRQSDLHRMDITPREGMRIVLRFQTRLDADGIDAVALERPFAGACSAKIVGIGNVLEYQP